MFFRIAEILISVVSGALVGWITNAIAINMLFRKYWKWGGVIKEHYEEFIENMSTLVEDDLVNAKTLRREFNTENFKKELTLWVEEVLERQLPTHSGTVRLDEIPGIERSIENLIPLLQEEEPDFIAGILKLFSRKELGDLVSQEQYRYLSEKNAAPVMDALLSRGEYIKNTVLGFLSRHKIAELVSPAGFNGITAFLKSVIKDADFSVFEAAAEKPCMELSNALDIESLVLKFEEHAASMKWNVFIPDPQRFAGKFTADLAGFANSEKGRELFAALASAHINDGRWIAEDLAEIAVHEFRVKFTGFIQDETSRTAEKLTALIVESRLEIEERINAAIDRQLESSARGKLLSGFKGLLGGNIAESFDAVGKIASYILKNSGRAGENFSGAFNSFTDNTTVGKVVAILEKKFPLQNVIAEALRKKAAGLHGDTAPLVKFLDEPAGNFRVDPSRIRTGLLSPLFKALKVRLFQSDSLKVSLAVRLEKALLRLQDLYVPDVFNPKNMSLFQNSGFFGTGFWETGLKPDFPIKSKVAVPEFDILEQPHKKFKFDREGIEWFLKGLWGNIAGFRLEKITAGILTGKLYINYRAIWERNRERELNQLYRLLQNPSLHDRISAGIQNTLLENIDPLLDRRISGLVSRELKKSSPQGINAMVQGFIGRELKPINAFGAFLGALVGGAGTAAALLLGLPKEFLPWMLPVYAFLFAFAGVGTNWIAVKMLFRPHEPLIGNLNISPFVGVVAAEKPRFAARIAGFVDSRLFNDTMLSRYFSEQKTQLQEYCGKWLEETDYGIINTIFGRETAGSETPGLSIFRFLQGYIREHETDIAAYVEAMAAGIGISENREEYCKKAGNFIAEKLAEADLAPALYGIFIRAIKGKTAAHYIEAAAPVLEEFFRDRFTDLIEEQNTGTLKDLVERFNDKFMDYTAGRSFIDMAGRETVGGFQDDLSRFLVTLLQKNSASLIRQFLERECAPDRRLKECFNGILPRLLRENIDRIIDLIVKAIKRRRFDIGRAIIEEMPGMLRVVAEDQVQSVVDIVIDEELPQFLQGKREALLSIGDELLENSFSETGFGADSLNYEVLKKIAAALLEAPSVCRAFRELVFGIAAMYTETPMAVFLKMFNIVTVQDLMNRVEPVFEFMMPELKSCLISAGVPDSIGAFAVKVLAGIAGELPAETLFENINAEKEFENIVSLMRKDPEIKAEVSVLVQTLSANITAEKDWYNAPLLQRDCSVFIRGLTGEDFAAAEALIPVFMRIFGKLNSALVPETRTSIASCLMTAILDALEIRFGNIIRSINIKDLTEREVNNMHPKEVEILFRKFADPYFRKITFYGWIGSFGGILSYFITWLLWMLER
ncbi:MAG: DUF445 domain-containing protein [Treponema sp.]|jgi:uncharacterized membrane protein YheB (UPF0754 family)|nr:DUF445 domain-containing protein [Treponema sp.]